MSRLWDRGVELDESIARLTVGRDPQLDLSLVEFDALGSAAHATMLTRIGVLDATDLERLLTELRAIASEGRDRTFRILTAEEDGHTAIENRLTARLGDAGKRIHTGRSRNDQVIAALRLWGRQALLSLASELVATVESLERLADEHRETSVPGYSHTRQAMPSTLGHLLAAWADGLLDLLPWLATAFKHVNRSPLGSASGFGVGLDLDRGLVSELLGFTVVQRNTLAVQNDRGRSEALVLGVAGTFLTDLGRLASDLIFYSADEVGFIRLAPETTTGSSIMPQTRNPDVLEIVRASAARLRGLRSEVESVYGTLGAGYHRDLQLTKGPFLEGMTLAVDCAVALRAVLETMAVDRERCRAAVLATTAATDAVYRRVAEGEPFRDAYRSVLEAPESAYPDDPAESWRARRHEGAPGDFDFDDLARRRQAGRDWVAERRAAIDGVWSWFEGGG